MWRLSSRNSHGKSSLLALVGLVVLGLITAGGLLLSSGRIDLGQPDRLPDSGPAKAPDQVPVRTEAGWLRITTHPASAHVFVQEGRKRVHTSYRYLGRTPLKKQLPIGRYQVVLFLNGTLVEREQEVTTSGERADLEIRLPVQQHPEMVLVKAGWFQFGSEKGHAVWERPQRRVYLDSYHIDKYEVSNRRYGLFLSYLREMGDQKHKRCHPRERKLDPNYDHEPTKLRSMHSLEGRKSFNQPNQPVAAVSWFDAYAYAAWAGKQLPTEAQWEKAAGWNDARKIKFPYPWGNDEGLEMAHLSQSVGTTAPVDAYPQGKSYYGCYQMIGNVYEWCADWWDPKGYAKMSPRDPRGPDKPPVDTKAQPGMRIVRGASGNFHHFMNNMRRTTYARYRLLPSFRNANVGFRCVINSPEKK